MPVANNNYLRDIESRVTRQYDAVQFDGRALWSILAECDSDCAHVPRVCGQGKRRLLRGHLHKKRQLEAHLFLAAAAHTPEATEGPSL